VLRLQRKMQRAACTKVKERKTWEEEDAAAGDIFYKDWQG
jgi:hypothetical protein